MNDVNVDELPANVAVVPSNPQTKSLMTVIRDRETPTAQYRFFSDRIVRLLIEHALSCLPVKPHTVVTPTGDEYQGSLFMGSIAGVSIMRAGQCMEPALRDCCPGVSIGTFLIQRDEASSEKAPDASVPFFHCLPEDVADRYVLVLDPMLATGGTVARAIRSLHDDHKVPYEHIITCHVISSLEGLKIIHAQFPSVRRRFWCCVCAAVSAMFPAVVFLRFCVRLRSSVARRVRPPPFPSSTAALEDYHF